MDNTISLDVMPDCVLYYGVLDSCFADKSHSCLRMRFEGINFEGRGA